MEFGRILTAMVTPMQADGSVDVEQAKRLAAAIIDCGSDGVVLAGTTGESPTLEFEEERELFGQLLPVCHEHGGVLIAGTGSNSTKTAVESSQRAQEIGVDGLLQVVPYYNKPSQEGMYQHFRAVAEAVDLPIILYNIPSRTGINMSAETQLRLAHDLPNIVGTKEATGDLELAVQIIAGAPDGFRVWSGDDANTLPLMSVGGYGVVSVLAHIVGAQIRAMVDAFVAGQVDEAARLHRQLLPVTKAMFLTSNPTPVKWALNHLGFAVGPTRLPLVEPPVEIQAQIMAELQQVQIDLPLPATSAR
jgi:4-hydroxy-tetrahydrodipicolinate synthase